MLIIISNKFIVLTEAGFREAMKYVLQGVFGVAVVDIDIVFRDREYIVVEIKSRVSSSDVATIH